MRKLFGSFFFALLLIASAFHATAQTKQIPNRLIDTSGFLQDINDSQKIRSASRVTEEEFATMMRGPDTIVLDARSLGKFHQMHIQGARHLDYTEFTADTLAAVIPSKSTRILIYCNNNIENEAIAFPSKIAKAALNLSTFTALYSYGYRNVFELGPVIDPHKAKIAFEGNLVRK